MLLLTNPNDPLGVIYKPGVVKNAILWARRNNVHTVVDEVFAMTVHKVCVPPPLDCCSAILSRLCIIHHLTYFKIWIIARKPP